MGFLAKVAHFLTILMIGYETNNAIQDKGSENHQIVIKTDEVFAKRVESDTEKVENNFDHHTIYLILIGIIIILLIIVVKLYKKLVNDVTRAVITA